jgi:hypothetical protein
VRRVIGGLRNEAWEVPSSLLAGGKDDGHHHAAIRACVDVMFRGLMGVGLSLVPEQGVEAISWRRIPTTWIRLAAKWADRWPSCGRAR